MRRTIDIMIFSICIVCFVVSIFADIKYDVGFKDDCEWYCYITYIFFHTNIIHLSINLYAFYLFNKVLYMFNGYKKNLVISFLSAIGCAIIINMIYPFDKVTIGLSGVIYAMLGCLIVTSNYNTKLLKSLVLVLVINILSLLFGSSNIWIHLSCLLTPIVISLINKLYAKYKLIR